MHPKHLSISDFDYQLPDEMIARFPLEQRHLSKLLLYKGGQIEQSTFTHLPQHLPPQTLLVFNNSKVIEARLLFKKETGGVIEIFALEPHEQYADITTAMQTTQRILYKCLVGGASKWKSGMVLEKKVETETGAVAIRAAIVERRPDCFVIEFSWSPADYSFAAMLHVMGAIPIPPYLHREAEVTDAERYQTIYAKADGSVAAPTAGLHFTPGVMEELAQCGMEMAYVTLHVGAGTFMPVKAAQMEGHQMHAEFIDVDIDLINKLAANQRIIPVGTTSMRTIESVYWMGVKARKNPSVTLPELEMKQWEVYDELQALAVSKADALASLVKWIQANGMGRLIVKTQIIIAPGYQFKIACGLVTNFHQPHSTLLLLVAALIGPSWKEVYEFALKNEFRFLSYGDSSLLLPAKG